MSDSNARWFVRPLPRPDAQWRLIGFPYGGGGPQAFRGWAEALPETVELVALNLPGRGSRLSEPPIDDMSALAPAIVDALTDLFDKPFAFFGHSVGALVAFETAHHLQDQHLPLPLRLLASAHQAPVAPPAGHDRTSETAMSELSDDDLIEVVRRLGLVPAEALDDPELLELILPPLRADFRLSDTYRPAASEPLRCPIAALGGDADELVSPADLAAWAPHTSAPFQTKVFEGDHFYTQPHLGELARMIADRVGADLAASPRSILEGPTEPYPDRCLHELFRDQAARTPDDIAVVDGQIHLTFRELDEQTDLLARFLQHRGVVVDSLVGVFMDTSLAYVVAYLAALKAGGAYLPIEVTYPDQLRHATLETARPVVVLTDTSNRDRMPADWADRALCLDETWVATLHGQDLPALDAGRELPGPDSLAYGVMSSGTTGTPKGILCPHRGAVNSYYWRYHHYPYGGDEREACNVFFVWEVMRPILRGRPAYIIPDDVVFDPPRLVGYLADNEITRVLLTPSLLEQILGTPGLEVTERLRHLKIVYLNGEVVTTALHRRAMARLPWITLLNDYSVSETHDVCTSDLASLDPRISPRYAPLGAPMSNVRVYLLDDDLRPVPRGLPGEIYVGGDSLARGYLNPRQTDERFVPDPIRGDGSRLFRSGDTGRVLHDGQLEISGRIAFMIKLRGYSIVPAAVEHAIAEHPAVETAVVTTQNDPHTGQPEHLVAYVVSNQPGDAERLMGELRSFLKGKLPRYAVPSYLVPVDEIPLASTGKLDRRRLPDPSAWRPAGREPMQNPPATTLERSVAEAYEHVLGVDAVEATDNFFDLGGHSLLAAELSSRLKNTHRLTVSVIDIFEHPTVRLLAASLEQAPDEGLAAAVTAAQAERTPASSSAIAVIGLACRFPGAPDADTFWRNLRGGARSIREITDDELAARGVPESIYRDPAYVKIGALLDDVDLFEPRFWGVSAKEATLMDPQQRLFLECCWQALEDAGYPPRHGGERTGVFGGVFLPSYLLHHLHGGGLLDPRDPMEQHLTEIGNDKDYLTTRVSHLLNLHGPSVAIQTSCSTSLVAVAAACQSLLAGQCDVALAGASSITFPQAGFYYAEGHINTRDGRCRPFDANAGGTLLGDGLGVVALKRLADAERDDDNILAVISGHAVNNDGSMKAGYSAPSVQGQAQVVAAAQAMAGADPRSFTYLECHGTGTLIGDPIEIRGLTEVFRRATPDRNFCAIGSVKANIGHSNIAAGMAGLIKTILALHHRELPPQIEYDTPNPGLDLGASPFYVNEILRKWPADGDRPRRAGVSCFGIGGTNSHLVVEEYVTPAAREATGSGGAYVLTLSARTPASLEKSRRTMIDRLDRNDLAPGDVAYTLRSGREQFPVRLAAVGADLAGLREGLEHPISGQARPGADGIAFMFPGQGSQYLGMGRGLYHSDPVFRRHYDSCREIVAPRLPVDLREVAFADELSPQFGRAEYLQPALFAVEYALARTLMSWGLAPTALVGHSLGEYVAACLAGVFDLDAALSLVLSRSHAMERAGAGAMASVKLAEDEARALVADDPSVEVAVINSPIDVVISGGLDGIERVETKLAESGVAHQRLRTGQAFHSPMMTQAAAEVAEAATMIELHPPQIPLLSNLTGDWFTDEQALDPGYWGRHLRQTVRFADDMERLVDRSPAVLLEAGPGRTLSGVARAIVARRRDPDAPGLDPLIVTCMRHAMEADKPDAQALGGAAGKLWVGGVDLELSAFGAGGAHRRISLPGYRFDGQRCWPAEVNTSALGAPAADHGDRKLSVDQWLYLPSWRRTLAPRSTTENLQAHRWLVLGGEDGDAGALGGLLRRELTNRGATVVTSMDADEIPERILDLRSLSDSSDAAYLDLLHLVRSLTTASATGARQLWVVTEGATQVAQEGIRPERAMLAGTCLVAAQENPELTCRMVDVQLDSGTPLEMIAGQVLGECTSPTADEALVAWRGYQRWVRDYEPVPAPASPASPLAAGGVYVITGGLGRIGRVLTEHLTALPATVVVTTRSDPPAHESGDVVVIRADLVEPGELERVVEQTLDRFGRLDGVFHAAGLAELAYLPDLSDEIVAREFTPKVTGVKQLSAVIEAMASRRGIKPGFVVLFSSMAAVLGGLAMGAYASANQYLDAFVQADPRRHGVRWLSINFDDWDFEYGKEQVAAYEQGDAARFAMSVPEGLEALERCLASSGAEQILVSTRPLQPRLDKWVRQGPARGKPETGESDPTATPQEPAADGLEGQVAAAYASVLGLPEVSPTDDFFDLGGDSLLAAQILANLRRSLGIGGAIQLKDIFDHPTARGLAALIKGQ